ncbi:MAG: ribosome silencing factor [Bacillota bacterium]|nr:ribosome silencing factor [Bacillota bacterium]
MKKNAIELCKYLDVKKAEDITLLDLRERSTLTDFFIIASARNSRHAKSLADDIADGAFEYDMHVKSIEGKQGGEWILIDLYDIVVHIFTPDMRSHYSLERIWHDAKKIEIDIDR